MYYSIGSLNPDIWKKILPRVDDLSLASLCQASKIIGLFFKSQLFNQDFLQARLRDKTGSSFSGKNIDDYFAQVLVRKNVRIHHNDVLEPQEPQVFYEQIGRFFRKIFSPPDVRPLVYSYRNQLFLGVDNKKAASFSLYPGTSYYKFGDKIAFCDEKRSMVVTNEALSSRALFKTDAMDRPANQMALTESRLLWIDTQSVWSWEYSTDKPPVQILVHNQDENKEYDVMRLFLDGDLLFVVDKDHVDIYENGGMKTHMKVTLAGSSISSIRLWKGEYLFYLDEMGTLRCQDLSGKRMALPEIRNVANYYFLDNEIYLVDRKGNCFFTHLGEEATDKKPILKNVQKILSIQGGYLLFLRAIGIQQYRLTYFDPIIKKVHKEYKLSDSFYNIYCDSTMVHVSGPDRLSVYGLIEAN